MKMDHLDDALKYRNQLKTLRDFRRRYLDGRATLYFDLGGHTLYPSECVRDAFLQLLEAEERMIVNTLECFGVSDARERPAPQENADG